MARRPYITPSEVPAARKTRCLSFPDSLEWEALVNGFLAMGTRPENWQELPGGITAEDAVAACVEFLNDFFEARECAPVFPIGTIIMFATSGQPDGWLVCDGQEVSRADYANLFLEISTNYGAGDGSTTFNVPDFRDYSPMGIGSTLLGFGGTAGALSVSLTAAQNGDHTHSLSDPGHSHAITDPGHVHRERVGNGANAFVLGAGGGANSTVAGNLTTNTAAMNTGSGTTGISIGDGFTGASVNSSGDGEPHNNLHPVIGTQFMIYAGAIV